jgi:hypothetical protein
MGDNEQMDRAVALAKGKRQAEHWVTNSRLLFKLVPATCNWLGDYPAGPSIWLCRREGVKRRRLPVRSGGMGRPLRERQRGEDESAAALALTNGRDVEYASALALGLAGDSSRSEALADDLDKRFPEDTFVRFHLSARSSWRYPRCTGANHGKCGATANRSSLRTGCEWAQRGLYLGGLHSAYVRGEAVVAGHQYAEAIAEFQKILDHRGIVGADPIGAWHTCNWAERSLLAETRPRRKLRTGISSLSGKTLTPTFRFWCKRRQSTARLQ